nr:EAL domain-containing protein [Kineococcus vitellinus]
MAAPSYEVIAREASDEVLVTTPDGTITFASPSFGSRWGLDRRRLLGADALSWVLPQDVPAVRARLAAVVRGQGPVEGEHRFVVRATGEVRWSHARLSDALRVPGVRGVVWNCRDVTELRRTTEALRHAATHDTLTGLGNRRELLRHVAEAAPGAAALGVVLLNLDGLKAVNDRHGHSGGDAVVRAVADRLAELVGEEGLLTRLDGDEFAVLLRGRARPVAAAAAVLAERALERVRRPVLVEGRAVVVTASAGTAVCEDPAGVEDPARRLFRQADVALTAAKAAGGDVGVAFSQRLLDAAHERAELAADLRAALAGGGVEVAYQPLVDLADGRTVGFEALARWRHPDRGPVPPSVFVPIAEESDLVLDLGAHVLTSALAQLRRWREGTGREDLEVSVNLSSRHLVQPGLVEQVRRALQEAGVPAAALCLEVTESAAVGDLEAARSALLALRALGVRTALDDFGTGYSSLSYLRRLPVDVVKIDKSFVDDHTEPSGRAVLAGIASLSGALGLLTVVEGIETEQAREIVRAAGCTWGQGYLFARPMPAEAVLAHLLGQGAGRGAQNLRERTTTA